MKRKSVPCCVALAAFAAAAFATPAAAAGTGTFSCQASALRVQALGLTVEPFVANKPDVPCADDQQGLINPTDVLGLVRVSVLSARTFNNPLGIPGTYAETEVLDLKLPIPDQASPLPLPLPAIHAEAVNTKAGSYCNGSQPAFYSDSKLVNLTIGGERIEIPDNKPFTIDVGILTIYINELIETPTSVTRRALRVTSPLLGLDVVAAESKANVEGNPCGPDSDPDPDPGTDPDPDPPADKPACSDGKDNDGDKLVDRKDPGCHTDRNAKNPKSYRPNDNSEANKYACHTKKKKHGPKKGKTILICVKVKVKV